MGFFFQKQAKAKKSAVTNVRFSTTARETLNRLSCKVCPLTTIRSENPKFPPSSKGEVDLYILGDFPTERDDETGRHFSGKTGSLLRQVLDDANIHDCRICFDYAVRDNLDGAGVREAGQALECCRSLVAGSIGAARPLVVLGVGIKALSWALNSTDMMGLRGRIFALQAGGHPFYFIPTYSPDFIVERAFNKDEPLRSSLGACLKFDVQRAFDALNLPPPQIDTPQAVRAGLQTFNGHGADQLAKLQKLMGGAAKASVKAIDLETWPLRPYAAGAKLLTCAISHDDENFAFAVDHPKGGWSAVQQKFIRKFLCEVLASEGVLVAHNTPFEVEWLISLLGRDAIFHDNWECTMMQSHFLDERRGKRGGNDDQFQPNPYQALDFLVKQYFGISYKPLFKLDRKNMLAADLDETLLYNAADTKYTLRLYGLQKRLLRERGLLNAYNEARLRQPTVALMQSIGINFDQKENKRLQTKLGDEIKSIEERIAKLPVVQQFVRDRKSFNPASQPDLLKIFKDYIKVGKALINDEGRETTDKSTLSKIPHPLAGLVENYRNRSKLKSTYVDAFELGKGQFVWGDAKVHPSFNTTFAETGRTSCDEPNVQNFPSRQDKYVRKQIVAPKGHVIVAFDYGQLEACTAAMCTKDKVLVKAMWEDYDIHMEWAQKAAHLYPAFVGGKENITDKDVMKKFRSKIKNKLVFPVIFGASNKSVAAYMGNSPQEPIDKLMNEFWRTFYGINRWQKDTMNEYYRCGYIASLTGRRRHYPLTKNQGVNYPIQSVACDIMCRAMVSLSRRAADTGNWYLTPIMSIHDDLTFAIPDKPKVLEEAIETIYRTMLTPKYDFINVPLSVTCSVGKNWLDMDEVGKFWSHKDC
jgi:uracil-DNA glycosylase family 4